MERIILTSFLLFLSSILFAADCVFNGGGDGTSWSNRRNWSCSQVPDPANDDVTIPFGFSVVNDRKRNFTFENGNSLTLNGSLNMRDKSIEFDGSNTSFHIGANGTLSMTRGLDFVNGGSGKIDSGASVTLRSLKTDDNSVLTNNARCIDVNQRIENLNESIINGTGCLSFNGGSGNFRNRGSGGIYGCPDSRLNDCSLDGGSTSLPVELKFFEAEAAEGGVDLSWATLAEVNNDYFTIERSSDQNLFEVVDTVNGNGNSTRLINYAYRDEIQFTGNLYYRLKQTDFNGNSETFDIAVVIVDTAEEEPDLKVYPNPLV